MTLWDPLTRGLKRSIPVLTAAAVAVVAVVFWKSFYLQVESYERAISLKFGSLSSRVLDPGAHFRLPYPIQEVFKVDVVNDRKLQIGFEESPDGERKHLQREALTLTEFGNLVELEMEVNYFIADPAKFALKVENPDLTMKEASESAMRTIVGQRTIDEVLTENKRDIVEQIQAKLQGIVDIYDMGVQVRRVQFVKAVNPYQVLEAFESVEGAKQDSGKAYLDALTYANQQLPQARANARRQVEAAKAYAQAVVSRAQGDSARFSQILEKYQQHKTVTRKRLYLETMEEVLPKVKKIIVDGKETTHLLPIGKL